MQCTVCGLFTAGDQCGNPGCDSNQMSQYSCPVCKTISPGLVCGNPGCTAYEGNSSLAKWNDKLSRAHFQGMGWGDLLQTLDSTTIAYIKDAKQSPKIEKEFVPKTGLVSCISFPKGRQWLWLCSAKAGPKLSWVPARIQLRHNGFMVWVLAREEFDVRVYFPKEVCDTRTDLRYFEIGAIFKKLGHDAEVANEMLWRVKGQFKTSFKPYDGFIDAMIVLMFGVEAGRNWSSCATSLMLLELIAWKQTYGSQGTKLFTLAKAFHHETKTWEDDGALYGGKHPMATHGTGSGNLIDRGKVVSVSGVGWDRAMSSDPKHHMVVYRELSILRHWLQFSETLDYYKQLTVAEKILKLLRTYLS